MYSDRKVFDLGITGAGPSGIAAAIQGVREGLSVLLLEKNEIGGQATSANLIENYPGFPDGISGEALMELFRKQLLYSQVHYEREDIFDIKKEGNLFILSGVHGRYQCRSAIVAAGLLSLSLPTDVKIHGKNEPNLSRNEPDEMSGIIFYYPNPSRIDCAGKRILVLGGGDCAYDEAISFVRRGAHVTIAMRSCPKASPALQSQTDGVLIDCLNGVNLVSVKHGEYGVMAAFKKTDGHVQTLDADYMIVCIGRKRCEKMFAMIEKNRLRREKGFYIVGDFAHPELRHVGIAVGDGISAAILAAKHVRSGVCRPPGESLNA
jgi:thioredoxin reductase (NADPH)